MNKEVIIEALKEARRVMKLTYVTEPGAKFTDAARIKAGEVMLQVEAALAELEGEEDA